MTCLRLSLAMLASLAATASRAATCDVSDFASNTFVDGPCTVQDVSPVPTTFAQAFTIKGRRVVVAFGEHQGRFHRWTLNGKPASAYEFNREAYCGWTDDLSESFCFAYRGAIPQ